MGLHAAMHAKWHRIFISIHVHALVASTLPDAYPAHSGMEPATSVSSKHSVLAMRVLLHTLGNKGGLVAVLLHSFHMLQAGALELVHSSLSLAVDS
jgi:hypothetical protein